MLSELSHVKPSLSSKDQTNKADVKHNQPAPSAKDQTNNSVPSRRDSTQLHDPSHEATVDSPWGLQRIEESSLNDDRLQATTSEDNSIDSVASHSRSTGDRTTSESTRHNGNIDNGRRGCRLRDKNGAYPEKRDVGDRLK